MPYRPYSSFYICHTRSKQTSHSWAKKWQGDARFTTQVSLIALLCKIGYFLYSSFLSALLIKSVFSDLIFSIPALVSWLSQGTTLPAGTIILTGTPSGIGMAMDPTEYLHEGDEFTVEILPHIGSLISTIKNE